jgi:hypothetical protein
VYRLNALWPQRLNWGINHHGRVPGHLFDHGRTATCSGTCATSRSGFPSVCSFGHDPALLLRRVSKTTQR